jgi:ubiquinone/menaquinone biosynthesis C-methylase UbiE
VTSVWNERADAYRRSETHRKGRDLDILVAWAAGAQRALDVATGGGHVARRLRESGIEVTSCDPAPGMRPDVVCPAERLTFLDGAFDLVACRLAAHHFDDVGAAVREMARVSSERVILVDTLFSGQAAEEAERLRDPSHVKSYSEREWRRMFEQAGLRVEEVSIVDGSLELAPWLERAGCSGHAAARVRGLLADRIEGGWVSFERICVRARRATG